MKEHVITSVQVSSRLGLFSKQWSKTILVMLHKVDSPTEASYFRPISLRNTLYKCITKCLVLRMKKVLPDIITPYQHAFIQGRSMLDNTMLSHELLHVINSKMSGPTTLAVTKKDMSKAYDRVHWNFII